MNMAIYNKIHNQTLSFDHFYLLDISCFEKESSLKERVAIHQVLLFTNQTNVHCNCVQIVSLTLSYRLATKKKKGKKLH